MTTLGEGVHRATEQLEGGGKSGAAVRTPKILLVTAVLPHAPDYGAQQRILNLGRILGRLGDLTLVVIASTPIDESSLDRTKREFRVGRVATVRPRPLEGWIDRFRFELDSRFINTHMGAIDDEDRHALLGLVEANDVVVVHSLRTANECGIFHWPHAVLDADDFPSQISITSARSSQTLLDWALYWRRYFSWRRREKAIGERFGSVVVCSEPDRSLVRTVRHVHVVPNSFPSPAVKPRRRVSDPPRIGFIGWLGGGPNSDGVQWFLRHVWPRVKRECPEARLRLVGGGSDRDYPAMGADVDLLGYLQDPTSEIETWRAMIVPIRIGGGTRVKIAHAFSRGCPVIATTLGAFGYDAVPGKHLLIADSPVRLANACLSLIQDPAKGAGIASAAWDLFVTRWTWDAIAPAVRGVVEAVLAETRGLPAPVGEAATEAGHVEAR